MSLTKIVLDRMTAFEKLIVEFSPGINVFIGTNGTGKTHLMKFAYAACDVSKTSADYAEKLTRVFLPSGGAPGRLVRRAVGRNAGSVEVHRSGCKLKASISTLMDESKKVRIAGADEWRKKPIESVYIPVKEMLSVAPGFRSLYAQRDIHFEEIYADVLDRAYKPLLRGPVDEYRGRLIRILGRYIGGNIKTENEEFFLSNRQGNLEFTLLSEGVRKLALLLVLIKNGTLTNGSVLFWDEPETNLNPSVFGTVIEVLLELQRHGVQVFLATHDYVILKRLELQRCTSDKVTFHSLFLENSDVKCRSTDSHIDIHPNAIADTFSDIYDQEIRKTLTGDDE
ncbi:MAG: AAA family ATPase [Planctomycetes bacterium]|nr:AAA family ATPase [Planctomycetota bacterium]